MRIYSVSGRKSHGKDFFASLVETAARVLDLQPFTRMHFATPLKTFSGEIFGLTREQLYDEAEKEKPLAQPINMDDFLSAMERVTGLKLEDTGLVATTSRMVLQQFGTNYIRKAKDTYWVDLCLSQAKQAGRVLIPDTRFPNEAAAVRAVGGKVIKVVRLDYPVSNDEHPSETEIDKIEPDLLIGAKTGELSLLKQVAILIALGEWDTAKNYDYRNLTEYQKEKEANPAASLFSSYYAS